ncbi:hypothetical protein ACROYT_G007693 [Oculina patagonica]
MPGEQNIADPLSRLLQENKQAESSLAHKVSDEFVRFVAVTATPRAMSTREIEEASSEDREFVELGQCIKKGNWKGDQHKQYIPVCNDLCVIRKLILRDTRIVIPSTLKPQVLSLAHDGHPGIVSMKQRLRSKVWWPEIYREAERFCKTCHGCQLDQGTEHRKTTPLWPQANGEVERQNKSLLKRMRIAQAKEKEWRKELRKYLVAYRSTPHTTTGVSPAKGKEWRKELRKYLVAYRSTPHTTTGVSPAELLFGRKMRTKLPELRDECIASEMRDRDGEMKAKANQYADKRRNPQESDLGTRLESDLTLGDKVLVRQERRNKFSTPFAPEPNDFITKSGNSVVIESS